MGCKVIVLSLCLILASVRATKVELKRIWKPELGWEMICSWTLYSNDSLQSVRLYRNDQQFLIYRPEVDRNEISGVYRRPEDTMLVHCAESTNRGVTGTCNVTIELFQPQKNSFTFACEASGERPTFRMQKQIIEIEAFVPPTKAALEVESQNKESGRVMLNCTSSGLPAPNLVWTIGEQKVPHDFTGSVWNPTSKLWDVWSLLSYTPSAKYTAVCTPETSKGSELVKGEAAEYNSASHIKEITSLIIAVSISMILLR